MGGKSSQPIWRWYAGLAALFVVTSAVVARFHPNLGLEIGYFSAGIVIAGAAVAYFCCPGKVYILSSPGFLAVLALLSLLISGIFGVILDEGNEFLRNAVIIGGVAGFGYLITTSVNLHNRIREHTFSLIGNVRFDVEYRQHATRIVSQLPAEVVPFKRIEQIMTTISGQDLLLRGSINIMMNFFELLAIAVITRNANETILREFYKSPVLAYSKKLQNMIVYQKLRGNHSVLSNLVWLVRRWKGELGELDQYERTQQSRAVPN